MNIIEEQWQDYRKQTLKEKVDPVMLEAYRTVFYAGAISTAAIITELESVEGAMETIMWAAVEHVIELESKGVAPNLKNNSGWEMLRAGS